MAVNSSNRPMSDSDTAETDTSQIDANALRLIHTLWPGERKHTMADVAQLVGVDVDMIVQMRVASGFPEPRSDARVATDEDVEFYRRIVAIQVIFGESQVMSLLRVLGASMSRVADATTSSYMINVQGDRSDADEPEVVDALVTELTTALDTLLRKHLVAARRTSSAATYRGGSPAQNYETQQLAVGFADLIGSTGLAERHTFEQIGALLSTFEETASTIVTRFGGRVVKLIGDEILFVSESPSQAARIAWSITQAVAEVPLLPGVRVGVAAGEVLMRDGDVFGPPVNRAARIVKQAPEGAVLVTPVVRAASLADFEFASCGDFTLPGFAAPTQLCQIVAPHREVRAEPETHDVE